VFSAGFFHGGHHGLFRFHHFDPHHHGFFYYGLHRPYSYSYWYYRPRYWWYPSYVDWYYGPWYRPYVHVTHVVDRTYGYDYGRRFLDDDEYGYDRGFDAGYDLGFDRGFEVGLEAEAEPAFPTLDEAWNLLADGYLNEARDAFMSLGELFPFEGEPQVGYAIAAGLLGNHDAAAHAMRTALENDPEALGKVPGILALVDHIVRLRDRYEEIARTTDRNTDALFMLAALRFLLNEEAVAYFAIDEAIEAGDDELSTAILKDRIRQSMYDRLYSE